MATITLDHVTKVFGKDTVAVDDVHLEIADGEFMVLVGPSGCGKSTLLRMIAGLEDVSAGGILVDGRDVTWASARERDLAMVFQNYALYPHMTVRRNLGFGLKLRKVPAAEAEARVAAVATTLGITELLDRKPAQLSGGQRQRVAMGRALVREPVAFLMDEPLSNLDAQLRTSVRSDLAELHARTGTTTVYVTHDQVEAMTLGQRVAVLCGGVLQQCDRPDVLFHEPANLFCATFIGSPRMNLALADVRDGTVRVGTLELQGVTAPCGDGRVVVGLRPSDLVLGGEVAGGTVLSAVADHVENLGARLHVSFEVEADAVVLTDDEAAVPGGAAPHARWCADLEEGRAIRPGDRLDLTLRTDRLHWFDPTTGARLVHGS
ncbi:MAG: ABC transporter ATP-binding protein [Actinomycetes bacterium]